MRRSPLLQTAALLGVVMLGIAPLAAQPAAPGDGDLAGQLARIAASLEAVENLLAQQVETQTLDLLMKRTQLVSAEAAQLDRQLRSAESSRDSMEDELMRIETQLDAFEAAGVEMPEEELIAMTAQMEAEQERLIRRLREVESEIVDLDSRLARKRREMDDWREILDRRLGGV